MSCPARDYAQHNTPLSAGQRGNGEQDQPISLKERRPFGPAGRYGAALCREGYTAFPNAVLTRYTQLGISEAELVLLQQIWVFWWDDTLPYPAVATLAARMGKSPRQIQRLLQRLSAAGLLTVVVRRDARGGQTSNAYDLTALVRAAERLVEQDGAPATCVPPVKQGANPDTRPLTAMSPKPDAIETNPSSISISIPPTPPQGPPRTRRPSAETGVVPSTLRESRPANPMPAVPGRPPEIGSQDVRAMVARVGQALGDSAPKSSATRIRRLHENSGLPEEAFARLVAGVAARVAPQLPAMRRRTSEGKPNAMPYFLASLAAALAPPSSEPPHERRPRSREENRAGGAAPLLPSGAPEPAGPPCWVRVRDALRGMLAAPVYAGHVQPLAAHLDTAGVLVLEAPTAFEAAWIESRLSRQIRDALGEDGTATGFRVEVAHNTASRERPHTAILALPPPNRPGARTR